MIPWAISIPPRPIIPSIRSKGAAASDETVNNGKTIFTKYKYPDNYEGYPATMNVYRMSVANILTPAVETQIWQKTSSDSTIIKAVVDDYDSATFKPSKKYFLFANPPLHT